MNKNIFTKSIQVLVISLLILAVVVPRKYSQKWMVFTLLLWAVFMIGGLLRNLIRSHKDMSTPMSLTRRLISKVQHKKDKPTQIVPTKLADSQSATSTQFSFTDEETDAMLRQMALRITDKLKSAYPNVIWQWKERPSLHDILAGITVRINVENMDNFTHADISFDRFGRIHVEPMSIGSFSTETITNDRESGYGAYSEPPVVDVRAWYELIGRKILEVQITELNANGHGKLTIKENGDIVINRQKKEVLIDTLESFPGKNYWDELVLLLKEYELNAKIAGNSLQVTWI
jgi:hypothetical protein